MTMVRGNKHAVGGFAPTAQPRPVGHEAKAPKAKELEQQPLPGGAKYHADTFEAGKSACKGGHAAEGKKEAGGHKKEKAGGEAPPAGGTPPTQGAYPSTPPTGEAPPAGGTPPVGQPADGAPEEGIQQAVEQIMSSIQKLIEALGGQPSQEPPTAPGGNTGIVPPGAVQGAPNGNTGIVPPGAVQATPPQSATPYAI
jgi:hypothetical protein